MVLSVCAKFGKILIRTVDVKPGMDGRTHTHTDTQTDGGEHSIHRDHSVAVDNNGALTDPILLDL